MYFILGGLFFLSVIVAMLNNSARFEIEKIKSGDVYAESITKDKLSSDVFNTVELTFADGTKSEAKILSGRVKDGVITGLLEIQKEDGSIITATVANQQFEIPDGSIVTVKLANNAVTGENLANGSVSTVKLIDGSITSGKLSEGVVLTEHIGNASVTSFKLADNSVTTSKILDNVITAPKIQSQAVTTAKLADNSITAVKIIDGSITEGKIASNAVTEFKLSDEAVATAKIKDGAITEVKVASGSISLSKLSNLMCANGEILKKSGGVWSCGSDIGSGGIVTSVTAGDGLTNTGTSSDPILNANVDNITIEINSNFLQIKDSAITEVKLANGSISTVKLQDASISNGKLQNNAVTEVKIADNSITSAKIVDGTITDSDISIIAAIAYSKLNLSNSIVDSDVSSSANIAWNKVSKLGSSLSDFAIRNASDINITDTGEYYTSTNVEGALQEVGGGLISNLNSSVILSPASSARNVIQPTGSGIVPLTIRGAASQTANLQEWQNSSGTILSSIGSGGLLTLGTEGHSDNKILAHGKIISKYFTNSLTLDPVDVSLSPNWGAPLRVKAINLEQDQVMDVLLLQRRLDSTPSPGFGGGLRFQGRSSTTYNRDMARIYALWSDATDGSRKSDLVLSSYEGGSERTQLYLRSGSNPQVEMRVTSGEMFGIRGESNHQIVQFYGDYGGGNQYGSLFLNELSSTKISLRAYGDSYINPVTGNLGIGNTTPGKKLDVTGEGRFSNTLTVTGGGIDVTGTITLASITSCSSGLQTDAGGVISCIPSDLSLKENIEKVENSLSIIERLRGVRYNWKDKEKYGINKEYGLIAQEVEEVVPELVFSMGDGNKGVKYMQMSGLLIEGIKEIKQKTEIIENRIQTIELAINKGTKEEGVLTTEQVISLISGNTLEKIKVKELIALTSVTVEGNLTVLGKTVLKGRIIGSSDTVGEFEILAGEIEKRINFVKKYDEQPTITLTPYSFITGQYKVFEVTKEYFKVLLSEAQSTDAKFSYLVVGIE